MMDKNRKYILPAILIGITLIFSACGVQTAQLDEEAFLSLLDTAVAATDIAQAAELELTQDAEPALPPTYTSQPSPTNTSIPDTPPAEPSPTGTEASNQTPAEDETAESIKFSLPGLSVQVTVDTNCRSGPGVSYRYLGALLVGEEASIYGQDPTGAWFYINNPDQEDGFCWIWNQYAQASGSTSPLPIFTPGPTSIPDPNFSTAYREVESCGGAWQVEFEIVNTGALPLESVSTFVQDTVTSATSASSAVNNFQKKTGCTVDSKKASLAPGETGFTVSLNLANDPTGHLTYASIKVCTEADLTGDCQTKELYFTP